MNINGINMLKNRNWNKIVKGIKVSGIVGCLCFGASTGLAVENTIGNVPIKIGGFFSTYANITDMETPYLRFAQATDTIDFNNETVLGLQFQADIGDKTTLYTQLVGDYYQDDFSVNLEWAYLKYKINDNIDFRMGKMGLPAFFFSDYLSVRYVYTWARVPSENYEMLPLNSYTGVDLLIRVPVGDYTLSLQPYFGNTNITSPFGFAGEVTTVLDDLYGISAELELETQTFRFGYFESTIGMKDPAIILALNNAVDLSAFGVPISDFISDIGMSFTSIGYSLTLGEFEFITEWSERDMSSNLVSSFQGNFTSFSYQVTETLRPYLVLAVLDNRNASSRPQEQKSITAGLRVDLSGTTALKIEWQNVDIDLSGNAANQGLFALGTTTGNEELDSVNMLSVGFNAVF